MGSAVGMWCIPQHRHQFDFVSGGVSLRCTLRGWVMGIVHPAGAEACSPGIFFYFYVLRDQFWCILAAQTVHILPLICLVLNSTGLQG